MQVLVSEASEACEEDLHKLTFGDFCPAQVVGTRRPVFSARRQPRGGLQAMIRYQVAKDLATFRPVLGAWQFEVARNPGQVSTPTCRVSLTSCSPCFVTMTKEALVLSPPFSVYHILIKGVSAFETGHLHNFLNRILLGNIEFFGACQVSWFYFLDSFWSAASPATCTCRFQPCPWVRSRITSRSNSAMASIM